MELLSNMSRRGNCWDNAAAESFFATLKKELIYPLGEVTIAFLRNPDEKQKRGFFIEEV